jgi:hypothetical protein
VAHMRTAQNYDDVDNLPLNFWDDLNADYAVPPNMLLDELGDMGTWFGLQWLGDATYTWSAEDITLSNHERASLPTRSPKSSLAYLHFISCSPSTCS